MKKMSILKMAGVMIWGALATGFVRPIVVNVEETPKAQKWEALEAEDQKKALKTEKDPLARAGLNQALGQFEDCVSEARKVPQKSIVKEWATLMELNCATQILNPDSKIKTSKNAGPLVSQTLKRADALQSHDNAVTSKLKSAIRQGRLALCGYYQKHARWKDLRNELQIALAAENEYEKSDRGRLYELAGDVLMADRQMVDAYNQFARAEDLNPSNDGIENKIRSMTPMLPLAIREQVEAKLKQGSATIPAAVANPSAEEQDIINLSQNYLSQNDPVSAVESLKKLIRKFPNGVRTKWAQDKVYELLSVEIEKSRGPQGPTVAKKKILNLMQDFDSDRLSEWGRALFDIQLYSDAAPLLKKAADQISGSPKASHPYYLAARAYQLSNNHSAAKEIYQLLLKSYAASPEIIDAAIEWALINIDENDPAEAISHLEVARTHKMSNQQDLVSLFWLYQSYKSKNVAQRLEETGSDLIKRFGMTYYGLIAYQDLKKALPQFGKTTGHTAKIYFSQNETLCLERARVLLAAGLLTEASEELAVFSNRTLNPDEEQYLANFYSQAIKHQKVFSLLSNLFDDAPERKTDFFVKRLFPKEYFQLVSDDKKRAELDPYLLLSVMRQESAFDHNALSHSGAVGLLQMIPPTADELKSELKYQGLLPHDLTDPAVNVRFCAYYLARLIKKYNGSIPLALAAYNAGPSRISQFLNARGGTLSDTWVDELPWAETSFYVKSILKNYIMYHILYGGLTQLPTPTWALAQPPPSQGSLSVDSGAGSK